MNDNPGYGASGPDALEREAARWFARMRGPEASDHAQDFERWLAADPQHEIAYHHAANIFAIGDFMARAAAPCDTTTPKTASDTRPSSGRTASGAAANDNAAWRWTCGLIAASVATLTGWWILSEPSRTTPDRTLPATQTTRPSLHMVNDTSTSATERLSDGSRVTLGAHGRLKVEFGAGRRDIRLERGHARFEVAHDGRPFTVHVAGGSVRALGTVFEVTRRPDGGVDVSLRKGSIEVVPPDGHGNPHGPRRLKAGESFSFMGEGKVAAPSPGGAPFSQALRAATVPTEETGEIRHFENVRVGDIVADANRAGPQQIIIADPRIADRRVSGWFSINEPLSLAERVALIFQLEIDRSDPSRLVLR